MERMERVLLHFEQEAKEYDDIIIKLIPSYIKMVSVLVDFISFDMHDTFSVIDLGCGTGTLSKAIAERFPHAAITCMDISQRMLQMTKSKINRDITTIQADFGQFEFPQKYDVIVSSLALHHLETDDDKQRFYGKIHSALNEHGLFMNIDVVTAPDKQIQKTYMDYWKEYMVANTSKDEVEGKWLPNYYAEDRPAPLITHLDMLREVGFPVVDVVYKYYNYAVFVGKK